MSHSYTGMFKLEDRGSESTQMQIQELRTWRYSILPDCSGLPSSSPLPGSLSRMGPGWLLCARTNQGPQRGSGCVCVRVQGPWSRHPVPINAPSARWEGSDPLIPSEAGIAPGLQGFLSLLCLPKAMRNRGGCGGVRWGCEDIEGNWIKETFGVEVRVPCCLGVLEVDAGFVC